MNSASSSKSSNKRGNATYAKGTRALPPLDICRRPLPSPSPSRSPGPSQRPLSSATPRTPSPSPSHISASSARSKSHSPAPQRQFTARPSASPRPCGLSHKLPSQLQAEAINTLRTLGIDKGYINRAMKIARERFTDECRAGVSYEGLTEIIYQLKILDNLGKPKGTEFNTRDELIKIGFEPNQVSRALKTQRNTLEEKSQENTQHELNAVTHLILKQRNQDREREGKKAYTFEYMPEQMGSHSESESAFQPASPDHADIQPLCEQIVKENSQAFDERGWSLTWSPSTSLVLKMKI